VEYGDIVVFTASDGEMRTYRVVGLPNDKLELNNNIVTINGIQSRVTFVKDTTLNEEDIPVSEFIEEFPNGQKHSIYKFQLPYDDAKTTIKDIIVPAGHYYLLGDNRDNALDSRY